MGAAPVVYKQQRRPSHDPAYFAVSFIACAVAIVVISLTKRLHKLLDSVVSSPVRAAVINPQTHSPSLLLVGIPCAVVVVAVTNPLLKPHPHLESGTFYPAVVATPNPHQDLLERHP